MENEILSKMKSESHGTSTSPVEILNISQHGIWMLINEDEYFLGYDHFPWFAEQPIEKIFKVELLHKDHLYWEDLDVDLHLDRIDVCC